VECENRIILELEMLREVYFVITHGQVIDTVMNAIRLMHLLDYPNYFDSSLKEQL